MIAQLEKSLLDTSAAYGAAEQSAEQAERVLNELNEVLQNMLDLETFNELLDIVRSLIKEQGEVARPNPNSAAVWHYSTYDLDGNGKIAFEETMHRTCGTVVIKDDLLYLADFSGLFHCVDATSGKPYWTHDLFAAVWGSALIVDGKVYVGDEEGKISVFKHDKVKKVISEIEMGNSVYTTPVVADDILYVANKTHIFAIAPDKK